MKKLIILITLVIIGSAFNAVAQETKFGNGTAIKAPPAGAERLDFIAQNPVYSSDYARRKHCWINYPGKGWTYGFVFLMMDGKAWGENRGLAAEIGLDQICNPGEEIVKHPDGFYWVNLPNPMLANAKPVANTNASIKTPPLGVSSDIGLVEVPAFPDKRVFVSKRDKKFLTADQKAICEGFSEGREVKTHTAPNGKTICYIDK